MILKKKLMKKENSLTSRSDLLNKQVEIVRTSNGSRYYGTIVGFRWKENRFCLSGLVLLGKNGEFKAAPKNSNKRWFSAEEFLISVV